MEKEGQSLTVLSDLILTSRFAIVGGGAAIVHLIAVWILIELGNVLPFLANLLAFLTAFTLAFFGHYYWTFSSPGNKLRAMRRYFISSAIAFLVNTILLSLLLRHVFISSSVAAAIAAGIIPILSYVTSRLWVFTRR